MTTLRCHSILTGDSGTSPQTSLVRLRRICITGGCRRSPTSRLATWFPPLNSRFAPTPFERRKVADAEPEAISIVVCVGCLTGRLRLAAILVSGLQVLVRGAAVSLGEIAGQ